MTGCRSRNLPHATPAAKKGIRYPQLWEWQKTAAALAVFDVAILFGEGPFEQGGLVKGSETMLRNPDRPGVPLELRQALALGEVIQAKEHLLKGNPQLMDKHVVRADLLLEQKRFRSLLARWRDASTEAARLQVQRGFEAEVTALSNRVPDRFPWLLAWRIYQLLKLVAKDHFHVEENFSFQAPAALMRDLRKRQGGARFVVKREALIYRVMGRPFTSPGHAAITEGWLS